MKYFSAAYLAALKDAIVAAVWYRAELNRFLTASLTDVSRLKIYNWDADKKRDIVNDLIDKLALDQDKNFEDFKRLTRGVLEMSRYPGLEKLEDSKALIEKAINLRADLERLVLAHNKTAETAKKDKEYEFLKEEYERRKHEDQSRAMRREEEDGLRKANPDRYFGRVLKLSGKISKDQIKAQYKDMVKVYHPDRFHALDSEFIDLATRRTQQLNEAFQYFSKKYGI
jgi:hypothetical protein